MPFLHCTVERGYIARALGIVAQYVNVFQVNCQTLSLGFATFDDQFDQFLVYSHSDHWLR